MKKTISKEPVQEVKKEFNLTEAFVLWKHTSKGGSQYLTGNTNEVATEKMKLVGYFNSNKKNPKEPDIRIYSLDAEGKQEKEVASLWEYLSKNETRYLSGTTSDKERLIGFYGDTTKEERPYIRTYFKED